MCVPLLLIMAPRLISAAAHVARGDAHSDVAMQIIRTVVRKRCYTFKPNIKLNTIANCIDNLVKPLRLIKVTFMFTIRVQQNKRYSIGVALKVFGLGKGRLSYKHCYSKSVDNADKNCIHYIFWGQFK